ncbi:uncharacterized protein LOC116616220 [Nematostella vectensis]|uniref:uncharacterized protein LOC116616220 n=1 Tax=Nematostella vectensis TaxID=45351 RepID=UPI0020778383|nr:uncharacterized protein LOC116616220 [Nematostella vectensis]
MWSAKYNPFVGFEALLSSSEGVFSMDTAPFSVDTPFLQPSGPLLGEDNFNNTSQLSICNGEEDQFAEPSSWSSFGSKVELPGGGFIELPSAEDDCREWTQSANNDKTQEHAVLVAKVDRLELESLEKDHVIGQISNENLLLRQEINRILQTVSHKNLELYHFRFESSRALRESEARVDELQQEVCSLKQDLSRVRAVCLETQSQASLVDLVRKKLDERRVENNALKWKVGALEKEIRDLQTKNEVLETELLIIPRMMAAKVSRNRNNATLQMHCSAHTVKVKVSGANLSRVSSDADREEKSFRTLPSPGANAREDPEEIQVLESQQDVPPHKPDESKTRTRNFSSLKNWFRRRPVTEHDQSLLSKLREN